MAREQVNANEAIAKTVEEAIRVAIQALAAAITERPQNAGPKISGPVMKQTNFDWEVANKYNELKNFRLEVNNIFRSYNMPHTETVNNCEQMVRQERPTIHRIQTHTEKEKCNTIEDLFHNA